MPDSTNDRARHGGDRAGYKVSGETPKSVLVGADESSELRRRWARALIDRASSSVPPYGSPEWLALPEGAPERIAAVVVAAEAWALGGEDIAGRLARELADRYAVEEQLRREDFDRDVVPMVRAMAQRPARYAGQQVRPLEAIGADYLRGAS